MTEQRAEPIETRTHTTAAYETDTFGSLPSGPSGTRKTDLGVLTSFRVVTIVAGALTPFVLITLFVAKLMMSDANTEQDRRLRLDFVERNEFNAWKDDVKRQLEEIKTNQRILQETQNQILIEIRKSR
jgi:hypothetical protein